MKKFVVGTVIAMVVSLGTLTAQGITAHASEMQTYEVDGFHTVSKTFELDGTPAKTITDEEREEMFKRIEENAKKSKMSAYEAYKAKNTEDWSKISNIFGF